MISSSGKVKLRRGRRDRSAKSTGRIQQLKDLLATAVPGSSLAVLRMAVGLVMALEGVALLLPHDAAITYGTPLEHYYTGDDLSFHMPFEGLEWLPMLPANWMYGLVGMLILAGVCMAAGMCYRISSATVFLVWAYLFAVESTRTYWQSHYYIELLTTFLLVWMPAANRWSLDRLIQSRAERAQRKVNEAEQEKIRSVATRSEPLPGMVPFWTIFLLRGQLVIAYFYAGVAKLSKDWLLDAAPVRWFLADHGVLTPYADYLSPELMEFGNSIVHSEALAYFLSYTGTVFDLAIGFLLLWRRTRIFGLVLMLIFHASNHLFLFDDIGWFPLVGATTALIFLEPDWPDRLWAWIRRPYFSKPDWRWATVGAVVFPVVGATLGWSLKPTEPKATGQFALSSFVLPFVIGWLVWQSVLPLRHNFIEGDGRITYEGFSFSWRLKADVRHAIGHILTIEDSRIISQTSGGTVLHWDEWKGSPCLYRKVQVSRVVWPRLPEIAVILEPGIGERIVYNPFSGRDVSFDEVTARERLKKYWLWQYDREPAIRTPLSRSQVAARLMRDLEQESKAQPALVQLRELLPDLDRLRRGETTNDESVDLVRRFAIVIRQLLNDFDEVVRPVLDESYPFLLQGESYRSAPFFIVQDDQLQKRDDDGVLRLNVAGWKLTKYTQEPGPEHRSMVGEGPVLVYFGGLGVERKTLLPLAYITDTHLDRRLEPEIRWNSLRDLSPSKYMHTSGQAFYLRRYARRVADLWTEQYGRRPKVFAKTGLSYNRRPHQELVDPRADLASVPVAWFRHNEWIRDLKVPRIPRDKLRGPAR